MNTKPYRLGDALEDVLNDLKPQGKTYPELFELDRGLPQQVTGNQWEPYWDPEGAAAVERGAREFLQRVAKHYEAGEVTSAPGVRAIVIPQEKFTFVPVPGHEDESPSAMWCKLHWEMTCINTLYASCIKEDPHAKLIEKLYPGRGPGSLDCPFVRWGEYTEQGGRPLPQVDPFELGRTYVTLAAAEELAWVIAHPKAYLGLCQGRRPKRDTPCGRWFISFPGGRQRAFCSAACQRSDSRRTAKLENQRKLLNAVDQASLSSSERRLWRKYSKKLARDLLLSHSELFHVRHWLAL